MGTGVSVWSCESGCEHVERVRACGAGVRVGVSVWVGVRTGVKGTGARDQV